MLWLKRLFSGIREAREPFYLPSASAIKTTGNAETAPLILDGPEEREKEHSHAFADNYRKYFRLGADDLFLLKSYTVDRQSSPGQELEYYDFIHRLADGTFVARYLVLDAEQYDRPSQSYRLSWQYDGNNRKLLQADLP
ncbi:hypothetical protein [uncultured Alteromonas sp.]|jgi:hypothetical protein|uniref:hypothetical protein n=1 Tax=uncultured Alteromonas sp. TaxID=179113 RepID=UPI0025E60D7E|nr:hypothetical protein [uncultured Alteromonas sp.]